MWITFVVILWKQPKDSYWYFSAILLWIHYEI
jgi:hypothetical protein